MALTVNDLYNLLKEAKDQGCGECSIMLDLAEGYDYNDYEPGMEFLEGSSTEVCKFPEVFIIYGIPENILNQR
ncbi:MAG: hypothetical protein R3321_02485 [Nitrososphaeraceae archaeon]|nr:hypothetical protein [Nitrososphaeraceae archaeon]